MDKVVFIDRDGTMGGAHTVERPQEYTPYPFTRAAFQLLKSNGFTLFIATNQSCIARHKDGGYDFAAEFRDIGADDWFICPHDTSDACACRKPDPGLLLQARDAYGLSLPHCYMVGDRWSDMAAGGRTGMRLVLVLTGRGPEAIGQDRGKWAAYAPSYVAADLLAAARWIVRDAAESPGDKTGTI